MALQKGTGLFKMNDALISILGAVVGVAERSRANDDRSSHNRDRSDNGRYMKRCGRDVLEPQIQVRISVWGSF